MKIEIAMAAEASEAAGRAETAQASEEGTTPPPGGEEAGSRKGKSALFRFRNALGIGLSIFLVAWPWGRTPPEPWLLATGGAIVLCGMLLRLWCILQIGGAARKTSKLKAELVISWGPYSIVRNPIYIANTTIFVGFTALSGLLWMVPVVIAALWLWYDSVVRREEAFILEKHPVAYADYLRYANRWIPRLQYRGKPQDIPRYPLRRALKRERGMLLNILAGLAAVVILRIVRW